MTFIQGHPPLETPVAWLLMRSDDGEGGVSDKAVLALRDGDDWYEAGDWKAESTLDSVHADGCWIVGWLPYAVPSPVLARQK